MRLEGKLNPFKENSFLVSTCDLQHFHCVARYEHETIERRARRFRSCGLLGNDRQFSTPILVRLTGAMVVVSYGQPPLPKILND